MKFLLPAALLVLSSGTRPQAPLDVRDDPFLSTITHTLAVSPTTANRVRNERKKKWRYSHGASLVLGAALTGGLKWIVPQTAPATWDCIHNASSSGGRLALANESNESILADLTPAVLRLVNASGRVDVGPAHYPEFSWANGSVPPFGFNWSLPPFRAAALDDPWTPFVSRHAHDLTPRVADPRVDAPLCVYPYCNASSESHHGPTIEEIEDEPSKEPEKSAAVHHEAPVHEAPVEEDDTHVVEPTDDDTPAVDATTTTTTPAAEATAEVPPVAAAFEGTSSVDAAVEGTDEVRPPAPAPPMPVQAAAEEDMSPPAPVPPMFTSHPVHAASFPHEAPVQERMTWIPSPPPPPGVLAHTTAEHAEHEHAEHEHAE